MALGLPVSWLRDVLPRGGGAGVCRVLSVLRLVDEGAFALTEGAFAFGLGAVIARS